MKQHPNHEAASALLGEINVLASQLDDFKTATNVAVFANNWFTDRWSPRHQNMDILPIAADSGQDTHFAARKAAAADPYALAAVNFIDHLAAVCANLLAEKQAAYNALFAPTPR